MCVYEFPIKYHRYHVNCYVVTPLKTYSIFCTIDLDEEMMPVNRCFDKGRYQVLFGIY